MAYSFTEDLPFLPEEKLFFDREEKSPWLASSEGLVFIASEDQSPDQSAVGRWLTFVNKAKFYMRVGEEPKTDWQLTLAASFYDTFKETSRDVLPIQLSVNNIPIGEWNVPSERGEKSFMIPQSLIRESFNDAMGLLTLRIDLPDVPTIGLGGFIFPNLGIQLNSMTWSPVHSKDMP